MIRIAVSPYHLATREPPALAALLLADEVYTLLPAPLSESGADAARRAAARSRIFADCVRRLAWSEPLWKAGVVLPAGAGAGCLAEVRTVTERIALGGVLEPLRALMHERLFADDATYLEAFAADILKGGPDPGITVPVSAGLDRFAARHALLVARAHPTSVAQQAESRLLRDRRTITLPALVQADAMRLLHARDVLAGPLALLRKALSAQANPDQRQLAEAAAAYTSAFKELRDDIFADAEEDDVRAVEGTLALTIGWLPSDAVLRSSLAAMDALRFGRRGKAAEAADEPAALTRLDPVDAMQVTAFVVRPLGIAAAAC